LAALTGWDVSKYNYYVDAYAKKADWYDSKTGSNTDEIYYNPYIKNVLGLFAGSDFWDGGNGPGTGGNAIWLIVVLALSMVAGVGVLFSGKIRMVNLYDRQPGIPN